MKSTLAWVVGRGGLLGSHLQHSLPTRLPDADCWECVPPRFSWKDRPALEAQLEEAVAAFADVARAGYERWAVLWAAGAGVIGTSTQDFQAEAQTWQHFLELLDQRLLLHQAMPGYVFLASSAGGVYGGNTAQVITEETPLAPASEYGKHKLRLEGMLKDWADPRPEVSYLIGRISNLYGPGQNLSKPQGLISHVVRCLIHHRPVQIYVSMDTLRDYLYVEDCAEYVLQCLTQLMTERERTGTPGRVTKILASEKATSLAQIVGIFSRIAKQKPRVICTPSPLSKQQPRRLEFRSNIWRHLPVPVHTDLQVGINRVYQHQLRLFQRGNLPAPASV